MARFLLSSVSFSRLLQWLFIGSSCIACLLVSGQVMAQQLDTQPLAVTSVCAGATIDVKGVKSSGGVSFTVELSDNGITYSEIPSTVIESSSRYEFTCRATIPIGTPAGKNYRIRLVSKSPDVVGTPSPSVLTVKAKPVPPTLDAIQLDCQRRTANDAFTNIYAKISSGASAKIYDARSKLLQDGSQLSVDQTTVYFALPKSLADADNGFRYPISETVYNVSQVVDGCESEKVPTTSRMLYRPSGGPTPANQFAAGIGKLTYCQGDKAVPLNVNGHSAPPENYQTLYALDGTTTSPTTTPPIPDTSVPGSHTYRLGLVPVDSQKGCASSASAAGPFLKVDVNARPAKPTVSANPLSLCQFATPARLSAVGEELVWYTADSIKLASAPLVNTDKAASFTVLVAQTVNGCEGPKAVLTATVQATPAPVVNKPLVEVCQGTMLQPLDATGTNLKWTDPNGNVTTTAPTPPTTSVTTKPEGDVYYVTQTGANGCESPKTAIHVFVQTTPTVSIRGTATTNLGLEVPLTLTFTGVGPYRFKLSNGLVGTSVKDTTLLVLPDHTTTYQVTEVANKCGTVLPANASSATVTVLTPTIETLVLASTTLCAGTSLTTNFITTGTLNPGSVFKLQIAPVETDTAKINFADIPGTLAADGKLTGTIPANTSGGSYWIRVTATNPKIPIKGSISPTRLTIQARPTATLTGNQTTYEGQPATLSVAFSGDAPWKFSYHDSTATGVGSTRVVSTSINPYAFDARPTKTTSYLLTSVSNGCGEGILLRQLAVVNLIPLLGVDDQSLANSVTVYPVPATTTLTIQIKGLSVAEPALLELTDLTGQPISRQQTRQAESLLRLDQYPAGTYILRINVGDRTASKRIVKF